MLEQRDRVYVLVDGPNYSGGTANNFQVDLSKLKSKLESRYGHIEKFLWYDIEPEIENIDFERSSSRRLENIVNSESDKEKIIQLVQEDPEIAREAINFYISMRKTKDIHEGKLRFLNAISNIAELKLFRGKTYREIKECECGREMIIVGKTEAGITDLHLAIDLIYYASQDFYDSAVLISGDGHYVQPISYVKDLGKKVYVVYFDININGELKAVANEFLSLNSLRADTELRKQT